MHQPSQQRSFCCSFQRKVKNKILIRCKYFTSKVLQLFYSHMFDSSASSCLGSELLWTRSISLQATRQNFNLLLSGVKCMPVRTPLSPTAMSSRPIASVETGVSVPERQYVLSTCCTLMELWLGVAVCKCILTHAYVCALLLHGSTCSY